MRERAVGPLRAAVLALALLSSACSASIGTAGADVAHVTGPFQTVSIPADGQYTVKYTVHGQCYRSFQLRSAGGQTVTVASNVNIGVYVAGVHNGTSTVALQHGTYTFDTTSFGGAGCTLSVDFYGPE